MANGKYWVFAQGEVHSGVGGHEAFDPVDLTGPDADLATTRRTLLRTRLLLQGEVGLVGPDGAVPHTALETTAFGNAVPLWYTYVVTVDNATGGGAGYTLGRDPNPDYRPGSHTLNPLGPVLLGHLIPSGPLYIPPNSPTGPYPDGGWIRSYSLSQVDGNSEARRTAAPEFPLSSRVHVDAATDGSEPATVGGGWSWLLAQLVAWTDEV